MPTLINASTKSLSNVFDKSYAFVIPSYQRPYSWEKDQAEVLLQDLIDFQGVKKDDGYFLGSIVLIKDEKQVSAEVIDGQQRLTTLTILIACLAERARDLGEQDIEMYREYLYEKGNLLSNTPRQPRLTLRDKDKVFFETYIQGLKIDDMLKLDPLQLPTDAQRNLLKNTGYLRAKIQELFDAPDKLVGFASFLMTECYLVVVSTPSQESAFRVFSTMNSRGLDLNTPDILKAKILGALPEADRDAYSDEWESLEEGLGREEFDNLFGHIRTLYRPEKQRETLLKEFNEHVLDRYNDKKVLIRDVIAPYAIAYGQVLAQNYKATAMAEKANEALTWLERVDHRDWVPAALQIIVCHKEDGEKVADLLTRLERLAACLFISHVGASQRIARYGKVVADLRQGSNTALDLTDAEIRLFAEYLDKDIYEMSAKRKNFIIRRLDRFMSDGGATYNHKNFTIEHVMPQTFKPGSEWETWWPNVEDRKQWVHRLANLVALNQYRNSAAGNRDLLEKIRTYLKGRNGVPSYTLTIKMLGATSWNKADLEARQKELIATMLDGWEIVIPHATQAKAVNA